jgi:hypothetical protein
MSRELWAVIIFRYSILLGVVGASIRLNWCHRLLFISQVDNQSYILVLKRR